MNFLRGKRENGEFVNPNLRFTLPASIRNAGKSSDIIVGLRPEQLKLAGSGGNVKATVAVEVVEPLGNEMLIYVSLGEERLVVRTEPNLNISPDDRLTLYFDPEAVHYFDGATDAALK